jgi:hypothetical protein
MNTTVGDVNRALAAKGIAVTLPYPEDWLVRDLQILEKRDTAGSVRVLLAVELDRGGQLIRDLCVLEGEIERERRTGPACPPLAQKQKHLLPLRDQPDFANDSEAWAYLKEAFASLLQEHDYRLEDHPETDLYGSLGPRGFFLMLSPRCDESAADKAERLVELRKTYKHLHDYGLVLLAFQEPLGVPLSRQEAWIMARADRLSAHRVGVYGVDNTDPNRIYPFTVYPQVRGLLRYFVAASRQWQDVRTQYLLSRTEGASRK